MKYLVGALLGAVGVLVILAWLYVHYMEKV